MSILDIKNLSHIFDTKPLFSHADLSINNGEHVGIVGLNGAGKSTFINIIAGLLNQDEGEVKWQNGIKKGYLDQHANINRSLTVMEYLNESFADLFSENARMDSIYESMGDISDPDELDRLIKKATGIMDRLNDAGFFELDATIKKVANGLGIHNFGYDTIIDTLSGGQRAKLMLARLLLEQPDIMMLDEPTNFLDIEHIEWLVGYLNGFKKTFLVISHDTSFLDKICKFIVSIENGSIKKYGGNYSQYLSQAQENAKQYEENYARQQAEIAKMEDYIARNKARAATAGMASSRQKLLNKMDVLNKPSVIYDAEFNFPVEPLHTRDMLVTNNLEIGYNGFSLLPPINIHLDGETKLWIRGTNGIGKTTLLKTLMGLLAPVSGYFSLHPFIKAGYIEQDVSFGDASTNAINYIQNMFPKMVIKQVRACLAKVGIKNDLAIKPFNELSGGEQVRVKLCFLTNKTTNILVLDEPTNHLDVRAKSALAQALIDYKGAILLVSHEKEWAESICNSIFDARA